MRLLIAVCALAIAASANAAVPVSQRDALIAIYQSTGGPSWTDRSGWLGAPGTECSWKGVGCDEQQANVIVLELYDNNLTGTLPSAIRNLTHLRSLQVYQNRLGGHLPAELGELAELSSFYAQSNAFTGPIPASFGALKKLEVLGLDGNQLTGPLPRELGSMTALRELTIAYNAIDGPIPPELANLPNLELFEASANRLSGPIPPQLGGAPKLQTLGLSDNLLTGKIPPELGDSATLIELRASYNDLDGPIPAALGRLSNLERLDLGNNALTGRIPNELSSLAKLRHLDLTTNELEGELTPLFSLTALEELHLGDNAFSGTLSPQIGNLGNLQVLALYDNQLTGAIPLELTTIAPLRSLELQRNDFDGKIPAELSRLTNLTWIDLSANALDGPIPPQLGTLSKLQVLHLYENELEDTIPNDLGRLANLEILTLSANRLHGTIPDALRDLKKLRQLFVNGNRLTGEIPSWIGELAELTDLFVGENALTGTIPSGIATLEKLNYLDVSENRLTGSLPDFTRLGALRYVNLQHNQLGGAIPASIGALTNVIDVYFNDNAFTGPLPREIGNLTRAEYVSFANNSIEGAIPPEISGLQSAYALSLWGNRFTGTIPKEIGQLTNLQFLDLSFNALRGPIPAEIMNLTKLEALRSDFSYNALFTDNQAIRAFVNAKQYDQDFEQTQTVMPANVRITQLTDRSATLQWTPIRYNYDGGGYQVIVSTTPNGPPVAIATTSSKELDSITVRNLNPSTNYFFRVTTVTHPGAYQENLVVSDATQPLQGSTTQRVVAPPDVAISEATEGLVQIDGVAVKDDQFTLTNFGDVATTITLARGGDFFTVAPETFQLAGGASQVVTLKSLPRAAGTYYGHVAIQGHGAADDLIAYVVLLAVARPAGTVVAEPLAATIELAGAPGSDSVGVAQFRNIGTARLSGIVLSDQPWVVPDPQPITIEPGAIGTVNFRVVRSKRPPGEGALAANLSLVYVDGGVAALHGALGASSSGVSVSKVTVVDVTKPPVAPGNAPPLSAGEIPLFVPGLVNRGNVRSDLSLLNSAGGRAINDLKLYFTSGSSTNVATLAPLGASAALSLTNILGNVYNASNTAGTLQIRSSEWQSVGASAKVTAVTSAGTLSGTIPIFRGDRALLPAQRAYLTGLSAPGDLVLQEAGGVNATAAIEFYDASGAVVATKNELLSANALTELRNAIPSNAKSAMIAISGASALFAYARLSDAASGDTWSVVDWSLLQRFNRNEAVRIPYVDGRGAGGGRRRSVRPLASTPRARTDVALFNHGTVEARAKLELIETSGHVIEREVVVAPRTTNTIVDAGAIAGSTTAHLVVRPLSGELTVTARSVAANVGTAIPVVSATAGLRVGQSQIFSGLADSAAMQTSYGLVESSGASVRVRARIIIGETHALVTATTTRTFDLGPRQQIVLPELLRSFAGDARDTAYGDLHDLVLELEVIAGSGSVVPFIIEKDKGTNDTVMRLQ